MNKIIARTLVGFFGFWFFADRCAQMSAGVTGLQAFLIPLAALVATAGWFVALRLAFTNLK